jgi:multidrug transporter EmrE-like cation transporter
MFDIAPGVIELLRWCDSMPKLPLFILGCIFLVLGVWSFSFTGERLSSSDTYSIWDGNGLLKAKENAVALSAILAIAGILLISCSMIGVHALQKSVLGLEVTDLKGDIRRDTSAVHANASDFDALVRRGDAYWASFDCKHAVDDYTNALKLRPDAAEVYRKRATVEEAMMHSDEAAKDWEMAKRLRRKAR